MPAGAINNFLSGVLDFIYPPRCLVCRKLIQENEGLCVDCLEKIQLIEKPYCHKCGKPLEFEATFEDVQAPVCLDCRNKKLFFNFARSIGRYDGVLKECVHFLKYRSKKVLLKPISCLISKNLENTFLWEEFSFITPVPLHKKRYREREFNQAELIADLIGKQFRISVLPQALERTVYTSPQIKLNKEERLRNVKGVFKAGEHPWIRNSRILLVDDVYTTGSTLNECARVLKKAGAQEVYAFTLAHGI